jgi:predicted GIY-YIG superfamily endonuclease
MTHYLYILFSSDEFCKIGISNNPEQRLSDIQGHNHHVLTLCAVIGFDNEESALNAERRIHGFYNNERVHGEWFEIEVVSISINQLTVLGATHIEFMNVQKVTSDNRNYTSNASDKVRAYFEQYPEHTNWRVRELAEVIGVGKSTVSSVRKELR